MRTLLAVKLDYGLFNSDRNKRMATVYFITIPCEPNTVCTKNIVYIMGLELCVLCVFL